jgi:peptide/nickel transport system permease protein
MAEALAPGAVVADGLALDRGWRRVGPARFDGRARRRGALAAAVVLLLLVGAALLVPVLVPLDQRLVHLDAVSRAPSLTHPFGTDDLGRDVLVRCLYALRVSLTVAVATAAVATMLGGLIGLLAATFGGLVDRLLMRLVDAVASLPHLLLGIFIVALFRPGPAGIVASIAVTHWLSVARIVRSEVLSLRERRFVDAAFSGGSGRGRILRRHFLPHVLPHLGLAVALLVPHAVWHESALSFLGLGLPPHLASLGTMINDAQRSLLAGAWWTSLAPGLFIIAPTLAVSVLAGHARDRVNPRWHSELQL